MKDIEILAYSPTDMEQFDKYVVEGLKDENGNPKKDRHDRLITGVIPWLHGRLIPEVHFFSSRPAHPVKVFLTTLLPPETEEEEVPWMRDLPGLDEVIRVDGVIGAAPDFGATIKTGTTTPAGWIEPRPDLDAIFVMEGERIAAIDFSKLSFTREAFSSALMGDPGTNLPERLLEIQSLLKLNVLATHLPLTR